MLLTEYLDSIQGTEQEAEFLEKMAGLKVHFERAARMPFVGKFIMALAAIGDSQSIEDFEQSEHYETIQGWVIKVDPDTGFFSINPGPAQMKKFLLILVGIGLGIFLLWRCIKRLRK
ncbi:MAG: hypothetical protein LBE35_03170 [Clostridiales bacterium]|jgi:hypothetical protein|nr:hypothetical protein [Clostridiales bacterium]